MSFSSLDACEEDCRMEAEDMCGKTFFFLTGTSERPKKKLALIFVRKDQESFFFSICPFKQKN